MTTHKETAPPQWRSRPPLYQHLKLELDALADGHSLIRLPYQDHLGNSRGEVHGGAVAALVDAAMSQAARSILEAGAGVATMSMTLNYLAPAHGELVCSGSVIRSGRSVAFLEAEVRDDTGKPVCRASASYRLLRRK